MTDSPLALSEDTATEPSVVHAPTRRPTRSDSVPSRLEALIRDETQRLGRGVAAAELYEPYATRFGSVKPSVLTNALSVLCRRRQVSKVGGRLKRTRYAHIEHPVPFGESEDPAPQLLAAVEEGTEELGRAMSTREVADRLRAKGVTSLSIEQLLTLLNALAHGADQKARRAHRDWAKPLLRRFAERAPSGKVVLSWAPASGIYGRATNLRAPTDALRVAVQLASAELGRPVSRRELTLWLEAMQDPEAPARAREIAAHLRGANVRVLINNVRSHAKRTVVAEAVRIVETPLTGRGACRPRYMVGEVASAARAACLLEDLAYLLTPADELEGIAALERIAADMRSPTLARLAALRRALLTASLAKHGPPDASVAEWVEAGAHVSRHAASRVCDWIDAATDVPERARAIAHLHLATRDLEMAAFERCVASSDERPGCPLLPEARSVLTEAGVPLANFESLVREANALTRRQPRHWSAVLKPARRVRTPRKSIRVVRSHAEAHSFLDRPDALGLLARECHLPRLNALLVTATLALGQVLRDPALIAQYLAELMPHELDARRALSMALALLGVAPEPDAAWPDSSNAEDAALYVAAVCLAVDCDDERRRLLTEADRRARGPARRTTDQALMRVEGGARFSVID